VVTGNTAVDAIASERKRAVLPHEPRGKRLVAVTMHRRENLPVMAQLAVALAAVARANRVHTFVYPVRLNPAVSDAVVAPLRDLPNCVLSDLSDYQTMGALLAASELVLTGSGGIQGEGAALGVPVAVLRNVTEGPEGVESGVLRLLGNDPTAVKAGLLQL